MPAIFFSYTNPVIDEVLTARCLIFLVPKAIRFAFLHIDSLRYTGVFDSDPPLEDGLFNIYPPRNFHTIKRITASDESEKMFH